MKEYKPSTFLFVLQMVIGLIMFCPTFGLWSVIMIRQILAYFNQSLTIGEQSVTMRTGILNINNHDLRYNKINTVLVRRPFFGRLFGYGSLVIYTGNDTSGITFDNIDSPEHIKALIDNMINNQPR